MDPDPADTYRALICGSRAWPWPWVVTEVLHRLFRRHGNNLVIIEGAATGADQAAHQWCLDGHWNDRRHRCYPVDWEAERRRNPHTWKLAGPHRNTTMLTTENPHIVIAFHDHINMAKGGTSDMCLKATLTGTPVWLIEGRQPTLGRYLKTTDFPTRRINHAKAELLIA